MVSSGCGTGRTEIGVIDQYVKLIRQLNPVGKLREYPGSPQISASLLRDQDRLQCTELHSTDFELLAKALCRQQTGAGGKAGCLAGHQGHAARRPIVAAWC